MDLPRIKWLTFVYTLYILSLKAGVVYVRDNQKWGNSQGLRRSPKALLDAVGLKERGQVELVQMDDGINIRHYLCHPHRTLEERLTARSTENPLTRLTG